MIKFIKKYKFCKSMGIRKPFRAALDRNFMKGVFLMEQDKKLYKFLSQYYVDNNWEKTTDKYGNVVETFLVLDDCAICFLFNPDGDLICTWHA